MLLQLFLLSCIPAVQSVLDFQRWMPPFNESSSVYELCTNEMDDIILLHNQHDKVLYYMEKYVLCYSDFQRFVPKKFHALVWFMKSLRFCAVNQLLTYNKYSQSYNRQFQLNFLRYSYAVVCDKGHLLPQPEHFDLFVYSSLFKLLHERANQDRQLVCNKVSVMYSDLYSRCYVPHVEKRERLVMERCSAQHTPLLKFTMFFERFSRDCDNFTTFVNTAKHALSSIGTALSNDVVFMNLLRLQLMHYSIATIKLYQQIVNVTTCKINYLEKNEANTTEEDWAEKESALLTHECCPHNNPICNLNNEKRYRALADHAWTLFLVEVSLLILVVFNTVMLAVLLLKTKRNLSTATVLFVFNIMFSNVLFLLSFIYFFTDLFTSVPYGGVNEDYADKSPELIVAETLQTHLFASDQYKDHLIQETLYSLAQNGSLIGLMHLLVLVLLVINRSMTGKTIRLSRVSVICFFACVWFFLISTHLLFSMLQISAIQNLDDLFTTLSKGRRYLQCHVQVLSGYEDIAEKCDRTAVFHTFGAYLLRGHTLFTLLFLALSIFIFAITILSHIKVRKAVRAGIREQSSPHQRRERLFHTLVLSISVFFLSVCFQTYIEIAVFWEHERESVVQLTKWYHLARITAFLDPVLNPLIVVARTPALRRQLRSQLTSLRSRASTRNRSQDSRLSSHRHRQNNSDSDQTKTQVEVRLMNTNRPLIRCQVSRRSQDSQTHNSIV